MKQIKYLIIASIFAGCSVQVNEKAKDERDSVAVASEDTVVVQETEGIVNGICGEEENEDSLLTQFARENIDREQVINLIESVYSEMNVEKESGAIYRMENVRVRQGDAVLGYEYAFYRDDCLAMELVFKDLESGDGTVREVVYVPCGGKLKVMERQDLEFYEEERDPVFGKDGKLQRRVVKRIYVDELGEDEVRICEYAGEDSTVKVIKGRVAE